MKKPTLSASYQWKQYWKERGIEAPKFQLGERVNFNKGDSEHSPLIIESIIPTERGWWYTLLLEGKIKGLRCPESELVGVD